MSSLTPRLADYFTRLFEIESIAASIPERADAYRRSFYRLLHEVGVEHCNFGIFGVEAGVGQAKEFAGSLMPEPFIEEYTEELAADDYILLRAGFLDERKPVDRFDFGLAFADQNRALNERAPLVQKACAENGGMADGVALIGQSAPGSAFDAPRFFGFAFGGDPSSGARARERFDELQIAAFALLDRLMPSMQASAGGFSYDLTPRERDVLGALANGMQRAQIAYHCNISTKTVDMHLANVRRKLRAQTLAEAVAKGYRYGLL